MVTSSIKTLETYLIKKKSKKKKFIGRVLGPIVTSAIFIF